MIEIRQTEVFLSWMGKLKTTPWDSAAYLKNDDDIAAYLEAVFEDARGCDPDFMGTLTALEEVGAEDAAKAYSEALAWFPGARPPDAKEARVRALRSIPQAERERASRLFWGAGDEVPRRLAAFIRTHQPELEAVLRARDAWRARRALRLP